MSKAMKDSPEVREQAVRMVFEHQKDHTWQWGGDRIDRREDRLHGADALQLGTAGRARPGAA